MKYRAWADEARLACTGNPQQKLDANHFLGFYAFSHHPMPESWSKKKKAELAGKLMFQKPDKNNVEKALEDALFDHDERIVLGGVQAQFWCMPSEEPRVDVFLIPRNACADDQTGIQ